MWVNSSWTKFRWEQRRISQVFSSRQRELSFIDIWGPLNIQNNIAIWKHSAGVKKPPIPSQFGLFKLTLKILRQSVWQTFHMWAWKTEHNHLRMSSKLSALSLIKSCGASVHILNYDIKGGWHFQWHLALIAIATERISF